MIPELFAVLLVFHVLGKFLDLCQKAVNLRESIDRVYGS
jgi:hypothetical protein